MIFAIFSGLLGTAFSVLIRLELSGPGVQYISDNQLYNSIITAHAILMIFFMVNNYSYMLNIKSPLPSINMSLVNINSNNITITSNDNKSEGYSESGGNNNGSLYMQHPLRDKYSSVLSTRFTATNSELTARRYYSSSSQMNP